jgi:hypothetical protein
MTIIDTNRRAGDRAQRLRRAGVTGVMRYYCRATKQAEKRLTRAEAENLVAAGLSVGVVYQGAGDGAASFSQEAGRRDGDYAQDYATSTIGQPEGSAIYFAVDYDAGAADVRDRIIPHFRGLRAASRAAGDRYRIGVYGSGAVCRAVLDDGLADLAWVSLSRGHRGTAAFLESGRWTLHQRSSSPICGIGVDVNELNPAARSYGEFSRLTGQGGGARIVREDRLSVEALQAALREAGYFPGGVDGDLAALTRAALLAFQYDHGLPPTGVADAEVWRALDGKARRLLGGNRVGASAETLRARGSRIIRDADNVKYAGALSTLLGALGLSNSAAVEIAGQMAGASPSGADPKRLVEAFEKVLGLTKITAKSAELDNLITAIKDLQGAALDKIVSPDNLKLLDLFKKALGSTEAAKDPVVKVFFEQLPSAAAVAKPPIHSIFDLFPGLFQDGTLHTLAQGLAEGAGGLTPGAGGSLLSLGIGLAARHFASRIIDARVDDHRTGANISR